MIKTEVIKGPSKMWNYPCLGEQNDGIIILFKERGKGTIIRGDDEWLVGTIIEVESMQDFTVFNGRITLSNK